LEICTLKCTVKSHAKENRLFRQLTSSQNGAFPNQVAKRRDAGYTTMMVAKSDEDERLLDVALWSGILPLLAGIGISVVWLATRALWTIPLGIVILLAGLCVNLRGWLNFAIYQHRTMRAKGTGGRELAALALLLLSYPGAYACFRIVGASSMDSVMRYDSIVRITVVNESGRNLSNIMLGGYGRDTARIDFLRNGASVSREFDPRTEGGIFVNVRDGATRRECLALAYVTAGAGGAAIVRFKPDLSCDSKQLR